MKRPGLIDDIRLVRQQIVSRQWMPDDGRLFRIFGDNWRLAWEALNMNSTPHATALVSREYPSWTMDMSTGTLSGKEILLALLQKMEDQLLEA